METTKTSKVRKTMTLTVAERADWISQFNAKSSFPSKDVPCSSCNEGITMFGTNLKNRVSRYDSVEDFLDTFVCRTCKGKAKKGEKVEKVQAVATHTEEEHEIIEDSYVVEPGDDDEVVSEQHEVIDDTADIEVFDDSDEVENEEVEESEESEETEEEVESEDVSEEITSFDDDSQEEDEEHQPVNTDAIREKYKAFYAMKR